MGLYESPGGDVIRNGYANPLVSCRVHISFCCRLVGGGVMMAVDGVMVMQFVAFEGYAFEKLGFDAAVSNDFRWRNWACSGMY